MSRVTERRRVTAAPLLFLVVAVLAAATTACRAPRKRETRPEPPPSLGDLLVGQLERRTDVRHVRLAVAPLDGTETPVGYRLDDRGVWVTEDRTLDRARAERIRERIIGELAARVRVVDIDAGWSGAEPDAASVESVNAVLVARLDPAGRGCVRVRARILDRETREILAVADVTME